MKHVKSRLKLIGNTYADYEDKAVYGADNMITSSKQQHYVKLKADNMNKVGSYKTKLATQNNLKSQTNSDHSSLKCD